MANLQRLLTDLLALSGHEDRCTKRLADPNSACKRYASELPLAHVRGTKGFKNIRDADPVLRSKQELYRLGIRAMRPNDEDAVEIELSTDDDVFTHVGPFRFHHPHAACGFLFKPMVEQCPKTSNGGIERPIATPFDSGGLVDHLLPNVSREQRIKFLRQHELPVPE
jgi:hypothetical protein